MKHRKRIMPAQDNLNQQGQIMLTILVLMAVGIIITGAATLISITNAQSGVIVEQGVYTVQQAESGVENAILQLLRNPSYTGETLNIDDTIITVTVTGTDPKTIISQAERNGFVSKIEAQVSYNDNILSVTSWRKVE